MKDNNNYRFITEWQNVTRRVYYVAKVDEHGEVLYESDKKEIWQEDCDVTDSGEINNKSIAEALKYYPGMNDSILEGVKTLQEEE